MVTAILIGCRTAIKSRIRLEEHHGPITRQVADYAVSGNDMPTVLERPRKDASLQIDGRASPELARTKAGITRDESQRLPHLAVSAKR